MLGWVGGCVDWPESHASSVYPLGRLLPSDRVWLKLLFQKMRIRQSPEEGQTRSDPTSLEIGLSLVSQNT